MLPPFSYKENLLQKKFKVPNTVLKDIQSKTSKLLNISTTWLNNREGFINNYIKNLINVQNFIQGKFQK
jgi:hypothetical protein